MKHPMEITAWRQRFFLFELLPYLAKVVVQDGIYWIKHYPNHEVSRLILNAMPPEYQRWAVKARSDIEALSTKNHAVLASDLNESAKSALLLVLDKLDTKFNEQNAEMAALTNKNRLLGESLTETLRAITQAIPRNIENGAPSEVTENRLVR